MKLKFISNNSNSLIIFLSGWGCDEFQFKKFLSSPSKNDILLCWDYSSLSFEFDFSQYKNIYLISYSAGVFIAGLIKQLFPKITKSIAINGNPLIFDDYFGIIKCSQEAMLSITLNNYLDFRKNYITHTKEQFEYFNKNSSLRSLESCFEEYAKLKEYASTTYPIFDFDVALISDNDKIFNPNHQLEYFKTNSKILKNSGHDVFYYFKSFDEILNF